MFAKERQDDIVEQVNQSGSVKVKDLSLKIRLQKIVYVKIWLS